MPKDVNWTKVGAPVQSDGIEPATIRTSGNPKEFLEGEALTVRDADNNGVADGDKPSFTMPPFANGKDHRYRG